MTRSAESGVLARAQRVVQDRRTLPDLVHRAMGRFSLVGTEPFLDPADVPWTALLEQHYPAIRAEAERVLRVRDALPNFQDIAPEQINLSDDDQWKTFWFVGYDVWDDPNCLRCPMTAAVLRVIPGLTTGFFSILGPGKRLPPHYGPYRGVLRHQDTINDVIIGAVSKSPFVKAARAQHVAREEAFARAWNAVTGDG